MQHEYRCDDCGACTDAEEGYFRADMEMFWCRDCVPDEERQELARLDALKR